jgi:protein AFG1
MLFLLGISYIVQALFFVPVFLKVEGKYRVHFHSFMLDVHARIHEVKKTVVRDYESTKPQPFDPIPPVARSISNNSWLICFDEFQASM